MHTYTLKDWQYKKSDSNEWKPSQKGFETTEIHPDLFSNGEIPDPFKDDNEKYLQWIGESDWEYKALFEFNDKNSKHQKLIFEGLDTFTDVFLNGTKILTT